MSAANRTARDLGPDDLVWDHFSRPREDDVVGRIHAASKAGFAAIGLFFSEWAAHRDDPAWVDAVDAALDETGIVIANIEALRGWASPDHATETCLAHEAIVWEMADRFTCRYLQVIGDYTGTVAEAGEGFGALCDRGADHGMLVGLEAVPSMTNIGTLTLATEIVERAGRDNGGICFDSWHLTRSTNDLDDIAIVGGDRIFATQFNDGTIAPQMDDYYIDCLSNRVSPGRGEFALVEMVRRLDELGSKAPIGLEVCSTELWELPVDEAARIVADDMRAVLAEARG